MLRFEKALDNLKKEGFQEGIRKGIQEGLKIGEQRAKEEVVKRMLDLDIDIATITAVTDLSVAKIEQLRV